jgi:hypothetical protein
MLCDIERIGPSSCTMSKHRLLTEDELGEKGQYFFDEICINAKLNSNPVRRDRTGWDRIVEFPPVEPRDALSHDKSPPPISCRVQVKTVWRGNDRIRMRLTAAERLAKDPNPAFIYVAHVDDSLSVTDAYLIHFAGPALAKVLARLRSEYVRHGGKKKLNRLFIAFTPSRIGRRLEPTGEAFRSSVVDAVGGLDNLPSYITDKAKQLRHIGFGPTPFSLTFTITADDTRQLSLGALGLEPITATNLRHFETRFDLKLPVPSFDAPTAKLTIKPSEPVGCRVIFRGPASLAPAAFKAEIRLPFLHPLPGGDDRFAILAELFTLHAPLSGGGRVHFETKRSALAVPRPPKEWRQLHRLLRILASNAASVECHVDDVQRPLEFSFTEIPSELDARFHSEAEEGARSLSRLADLAGASDLVVSSRAVLVCKADVDDCLAFADGKIGERFFEFSPSIATELDETKRRFIFIGTFPIDQRVAVFSVAALTRERNDGHGDVWSLEFERFLGVEIFCAGDNALDAYQARLAQRTGVSNLIVHYSPRFDRLSDAA